MNLPLPIRGARPTRAEDKRDIVQAIERLSLGQSNNTGTITLTANATTTAKTDNRVSTASVVQLVPQTATASTEDWYTTAANGSFTVTHTSTADTDKTFGYIIWG